MMQLLKTEKEIATPPASGQSAPRNRQSERVHCRLTALENGIGKRGTGILDRFIVILGCGSIHEGILQPPLVSGENPESIGFSLNKLLSNRYKSNGSSKILVGRQAYSLGSMHVKIFNRK